MNGPLPGGESIEGAAALVCVDLVVVAVDEQRPARHVEEEAENAEQNVLGTERGRLLVCFDIGIMGCVKFALILTQFAIRTRIGIRSTHRLRLCQLHEKTNSSDQLISMLQVA